MITSQTCHDHLRLKSQIICIFYKHPDCSLFIFAFLKPLLKPCCQSDDFIAMLRPGFRWVAHRDAVIAFACRAHALPVACARLIELHGWSVLQGDKRAGTWERQAAHSLNIHMNMYILSHFLCPSFSFYEPNRPQVSLTSGIIVYAKMLSLHWL